MFGKKSIRTRGAQVVTWLCAIFLALPSWASESVLLDGHTLTLQQVASVARSAAKVEIVPQAWDRVRRSHELLLDAGRAGQPVYGLNRGVGLNKDQTIFKGDAIDPEVRRLSERFNRAMLLSHTVAFGAEAPADVVRATMLIRLNTALFGGTGMQPMVVRQYAEFLNRGLTPVMRSQGSIGQADITILPQIGLAMMGLGEIVVSGKRLPAAEALQAAGLKPISPFAKDSLSMLSSNAYGAAWAVLTAVDTLHLLEQADAVAAMSLEGLNGNVAPFLAETQMQRPFTGQRQTAEHIVRLLQGSALWQIDDQRPLQDPLSFRTVSQVHGAVREMLGALEGQLSIQINSSDDNPTVALDIQPQADADSQRRRYYVTQGDNRGAILPSAGFDPTVWAVQLQSVGIALSHVAQSSAQRVLRLTDPSFTKLSRFLSPGDGVLAYSTIQKPVSALATEIRSLAQPVSTDTLVTSGNIEDVATNAPLAAQRVSSMQDRLRTLLGIELMHAAQAIDLRIKVEPRRSLGAGTSKWLTEFRRNVPFLAEDRRLAEDIAATDAFLRSPSVLP